MCSCPSYVGYSNFSVLYNSYGITSITHRGLIGQANYIAKEVSSTSRNSKNFFMNTLTGNNGNNAVQLCTKKTSLEINY